MRRHDPVDHIPQRSAGNQTKASNNFTGKVLVTVRHHTNKDYSYRGNKREDIGGSVNGTEEAERDSLV